MKQNTAKQNYPGSVAILTITRLAYSTMLSSPHGTLSWPMINRKTQQEIRLSLRDCASSAAAYTGG